MKTIDTKIYNADTIQSRKNLYELLKTGDVSFGMLTGTNTEGEDIIVGLTNDELVITTFQSNHWVRNNYYDKNGFHAGESYDERWN